MIDIEGIKARLDIAENGIKCAEQAIENAKACFDKAKEMLDAKDAKPQRNWPERIEAGMCFGISEGGVECQYIVSDASRLVCIASNTPRMIGGKWNSESLFRGCESRFTYLGHARDILTIRTDAHEPTGAELVGRVCEFSDDDFVSYTTRESECHGTGVRGYMTKLGVWWKFARLAR